MAKQYQVGRGAVREALRILETRGVLTIRPGRGGGPTVRRPRPSDLADSMSLFFQYEGARLSEVMEARNAIEPLSARLACARMGENELDELEATISSIRASPDDPENFSRQNAAFHSLIAVGSGSVILNIVAEALSTIADGEFAGVAYDRRARLAVADAHERILDAMRAADSDGAAHAMRDHLVEAGAFWSRRYPEQYSQRVAWSKRWR